MCTDSARAQIARKSTHVFHRLAMQPKLTHIDHNPSAYVWKLWFLETCVNLRVNLQIRLATLRMQVLALHTCDELRVRLARAFYMYLCYVTIQVKKWKGSSQLGLKQLQIKPRKNSEAPVGFKPMTSTIPVRYALPTELWSLTRSRSGASSICTRYVKKMTWSVNYKDYMSELRIKNRSERDLHNCKYLFHLYSLSAVHSYDLYHIHFTSIKVK